PPGFVEEDKQSGALEQSRLWGEPVDNVFDHCFEQVELRGSLDKGGADQAERFKALAAVTHLPKVQASRLRIAGSYERLAALAEDRLGLPQGSNRPTEEGRAPEQARVEDLSNDDRRVASAALIGLSRALCDVSTTLVREAREKLRHASAGDRSS